MTKTFSLILPVRDRLYLVNQLLDSIVETTSNIDLIELVLCIDEDDAESCRIDHPLIFIKKIILPYGTKGMGNIFRLCYIENTSRYMILINDDVIFRTNNWDIKILEAFSRTPDDLALVYPNDRYYGEKLCSFPVISQTVCELMNGICPCNYQSHSIDSHIFDIFERLAALGYERRRYLSKVVFEHMHYGVTLASYEGDFSPNRLDDQLLYSSLAEQRQRIAAKMAQYIQSYSGTQSAPLLPRVSVIMYISDTLSTSARKCLEIIYEDNKYRRLNYEIIIISDSLTDRKELSSLPGELRDNIRLVYCEKKNTAQIMYKAADVSNTNYLAFLNDDCLPRSNWLQSLTEAAIDDDIGIVGSKWINPRNGRIEHIGLSFFQNMGSTKETYLYKGFPSDHPSVNRLREIQAVKFPGMLIKKDILLQIDRLDDKFAGLEYLDLCIKVKELGKGIICSPQASLYCQCPEIINIGSNSSVQSAELPLELKNKIKCDLNEQLAKDGFVICSTGQGHYKNSMNLCLSGESK